MEHVDKKNKKDFKGESSTSPRAVPASNQDITETRFQEPVCGSDVVLVVEGKKLHVHKAVLSLSSPVFNSMFFSDFAEKDAKEIDLPDKKYDAMVDFLLHLYPQSSNEQIKGDTGLMTILPLADEYQVEHVLFKCKAYIGLQCDLACDMFGITDDRKMLYLVACEKYGLKQHFKKLLGIVSSGMRISAIQNSKRYALLTPDTKIALLQRRCEILEKK